MRLLLNLFKLRIGVAIALAAVAGIAVTPGALRSWQAVVLTLAVLVSASAAGAFNQYVERDLDARMARTRNRPFVSGALKHGPLWLWVIGAMTAASVLAAAFASNWLAAFYVFMGAFTYGVVYTRVVEAPHVVEHRHWRPSRQLCSACRCSGGDAGGARPAATLFRSHPVSVDAAAFLEPGDRFPRGL